MPNRLFLSTIKTYSYCAECHYQGNPKLSTKEIKVDIKLSVAFSTSKMMKLSIPFFLLFVGVAFAEDLEKESLEKVSNVFISQKLFLFCPLQ